MSDSRLVEHIWKCKTTLLCARGGWNRQLLTSTFATTTMETERDRDGRKHTKVGISAVQSLLLTFAHFRND